MYPTKRIHSDIPVPTESGRTLASRFSAQWRKLLGSLHMRRLARMRWLRESHVLFCRLPIEELRSGNKERVLYEAERATAK